MGILPWPPRMPLAFTYISSFLSHVNVRIKSIRKKITQQQSTSPWVVTQHLCQTCCAGHTKKSNTRNKSRSEKLMPYFINSRASELHKANQHEVCTAPKGKVLLAVKARKKVHRFWQFFGLIYGMFFCTVVLNWVVFFSEETIVLPLV